MMDRNKKNTEQVFGEYEWMEKMDEFDQQIQQDFLEEEFIRSCIEQLLDEEEERETMTAAEILQQKLHIDTEKQDIRVSENKPKVNGFTSQNYRNVLTNGTFSPMAESKLNPNAAVFVPRHSQPLPS